MTTITLEHKLTTGLQETGRNSDARTEKTLPPRLSPPSFENIEECGIVDNRFPRTTGLIVRGSDVRRGQFPWWVWSKASSRTFLNFIFTGLLLITTAVLVKVASSVVDHWSVRSWLSRVIFVKNLTLSLVTQILKFQRHIAFKASLTSFEKRQRKLSFSWGRTIWTHWTANQAASFLACRSLLFTPTGNSPRTATTQTLHWQFSRGQLLSISSWSLSAFGRGRLDMTTLSEATALWLVGERPRQMQSQPRNRNGPEFQLSPSRHVFDQTKFFQHWQAIARSVLEIEAGRLVRAMAILVSKTKLLLICVNLNFCAWQVVV